MILKVLNFFRDLNFVCRDQKIGLSFVVTKKLVIICQKIGHHLPKNWSMILEVLNFFRDLNFHLPKNWSFICQKIGLSFAKKLVFHLS